MIGEVARGSEVLGSEARMWHRTTATAEMHADRTAAEGHGCGAAVVQRGRGVGGWTWLVPVRGQQGKRERGGTQHGGVELCGGAALGVGGRCHGGTRA